MLRVIGGACLLISGLFVGLQLRRTDEVKITRMAVVVSLLRHAQRKISLFNTPTDELFADFSETADKDTARILQTMSTKDAVERIACILEADGDILRKFWRDVGAGYKADALATCQYCIETMEERLNQAKETFSKRKSLYLSLPVLLAISVIVLVL